MRHYVTYHADMGMDAAMRRQFECLLEEAFPPYERRVRSGQRALMQHPLYHIRTLQSDGRLLALMAVWMLDGMIFLEHFAVDAELRSGGIGGRMLDDLISEAHDSGRVLILEAEMPEDELTRRRIGFYERHAMTVNRYPYRQMPLREGDEPVEMRLLSSSALNERQFCAARREIYRHVYGICEEAF